MTSTRVQVLMAIASTLLTVAIFHLSGQTSTEALPPQPQAVEGARPAHLERRMAEAERTLYRHARDGNAADLARAISILEPLSTTTPEVKFRVHLAWCYRRAARRQEAERLLASSPDLRDIHDFFYGTEVATHLRYLLTAHCTRSLDVYSDALERHLKARGRYPDTLSALVPDFLPAALDCPETATPTYETRYRTLGGDGRGYILRCFNHADFNNQKDLAIWSVNGRRGYRFTDGDLVARYNVYTVALTVYNPRFRQTLLPLLQRAGVGKPAQRVADIGCGTGLFTFSLADQVGPRGKVYAIDINPSVLDYIRWVARRRGLANVTTIHSTFTGIGVPRGALDAALMIRVYNAVGRTSDDPEEVYTQYALPLLESIHDALKPGGRLLIQDLEAGLYEVGSIPSRQVIAHAERSGLFRHRETLMLGPDRYLLVFDRI